ncbi:hypothetical protein [Xanthomonas phage XPP9]|uniref:Uncharacterized protein n=1 Tax=Xanthomonas phage XPV1 TaxID=2099860 RepID=A0A3S7I6B2_9CAUD|nr:hypothetical protein KEM12_gp04 [Xanthomonas phage XPV1]AVO24129.1 hypothetical protein [Xanthomonas phage XPP9]AVO24168.1 hypothetical protein [Xanthomonas phage XPV1]AVO24306.1 hypothetical protein [Xanthomonas phage XPV2]AVO24367.1 hypothetical protein [Xanthomonas phage XPV3]
MIPDWDDAPDWAQYAACDYNGVWYWYDAEPYIHPSGVWAWYGVRAEAINPITVDWTDSKMRRP